MVYLAELLVVMTDRL